MKHSLMYCVLAVLVACKGNSEPAAKPAEGSSSTAATPTPAATDDKPAPVAKAAAKADARLNALGRFGVNWPLTADTLAAAVTEVEAKLGPGTKQADGTVVWAAMVDAQNAAEIGEGCNRITLKEEGGKLAARKETLKPGHPDFDACSTLAAAQFK